MLCLLAERINLLPQVIIHLLKAYFTMLVKQLAVQWLRQIFVIPFIASQKLLQQKFVRLNVKSLCQIVQRDAILQRQLK